MTEERTLSPNHEQKEIIEEKRREEKKYPYTYIRIRREFYIPSNYEQTFIELAKILKRENKSLSEWIRAHAVSYVNLHCPGNPQQRMDVILKHGRPYRAKLVCGCGQKATREATLTSGEKVLCCSLHLPNSVQHWKELR